jgi:hypothetical protein
MHSVLDIVEVAPVEQLIAMGLAGQRGAVLSIRRYPNGHYRYSIGSVLDPSAADEDDVPRIYDDEHLLPTGMRTSAEWTAPGILEALIPGRMQSHACTAEVPWATRRCRARAACPDGDVGVVACGRWRVHCHISAAPGWPFSYFSLGRVAGGNCAPGSPYLRAGNITEGAWSMRHGILGFLPFVLDLAGIFLGLALNCLSLVLSLLAHTHGRLLLCPAAPALPYTDHVPS